MKVGDAVKLEGDHAIGLQLFHPGDNLDMTWDPKDGILRIFRLTSSEHPLVYRGVAQEKEALEVAELFGMERGEDLRGNHAWSRKRPNVHIVTDSSEPGNRVIEEAIKLGLQPKIDFRKDHPDVPTFGIFLGTKGYGSTDFTADDMIDFLREAVGIKTPVPA